MRKRTLVALAICVGGLAIAAPIGLAMHLAEAQGRDAAFNYLDELATDVLRRSSSTRLQIHDAIDALINHPSEAPCSPEQLARMRTMTVTSSYLAGMGRVENNVLVCSTLSQGNAVFRLGPDDGTNRFDAKSWSDIELPGLPGEEFNLIVRDGYAALIYPDLAVDVLNNQSPVSLATLRTEPPSLLRSRGYVNPAWIERYNGQQVSFVDERYYVLIHPSDSGRTAALAAMPTTLVQAQVKQFAYILAPIGLLLGLLLAALVWHLARRRLSMTGELEVALDKKEFFLEYQPIIDLRTDECVGAEALIRWRNHEGKMISPDVFIPLAEAHGKIQRITALVIEIVLRDAAALLKANVGTHIAINLSTEDVQSSGMAGRLQEMTTAAGIAPASIMIEITERGLMSPEKSQSMLLAVRASGFRVAIDDFGTGHSSLSYLATYELDFLKIDKMFVDTLGTDAPTSLVTDHIIGLARSLGLQMIAEGVETPEQWQILRERGVQYAQGWFFGKPMSIAKLGEFIRARKKPSDPQRRAHSQVVEPAL